MDILMHLGLAVAGIAILCFGADRLVVGASQIAKRLGVSGFVIGLTVVAFGTSAPELAASVAAALSDQTDIILGNVVGSNIANVGMVIAAAAILGSSMIARHTLRREIPLMIGFCILLALLSIDGTIAVWDSIILLVCLLAFTLWAIRRPSPATTTPNTRGGARADRRRLLYNGIILVLGVAGLWIGSILTIDNAVAAAEWFGISGRIIGMAIIAVGTSMPELLTTIQSVRRHTPDIGMANIIGSNIINILMIVGVSSAITQIVVQPVVFIDYVIMTAFGACLFISWKYGKIPRLAGAGLAAAYVTYLAVSALI